MYVELRTDGYFEFEHLNKTPKRSLRCINNHIMSYLHCALYQMRWQTLPAVEKYTYPGVTLSSANRVDEVKPRLSKASSAFGRLHDNACDRRGFSTKTTKYVQGCSLAITFVWMQYFDRIQQACNEAQLIPPGMSQKNPQDKTRGQNPRHSSPR